MASSSRGTKGTHKASSGHDDLAINAQLLRIKSKRAVVYMEVGSEFVDHLSSILRMPVGSIAGLMDDSRIGICATWSSLMSVRSVLFDCEKSDMVPLAAVTVGFDTLKVQEDETKCSLCKSFPSNQYIGQHNPYSQQVYGVVQCRAGCGRVSACGELLYSSAFFSHVQENASFAAPALFNTSVNSGNRWLRIM